MTAILAASLMAMSAYVQTWDGAVTGHDLRPSDRRAYTNRSAQDHCPYCPIGHAMVRL